MEPKLGQCIFSAEKVMREDRTIDSSSRFRERKKQKHAHTHIRKHLELLFCTAGVQGALNILRPKTLILFFTVCSISGKM